MSITTNEHPILFSGPMIRAILDRRKTQTRRVMKPKRKPGFGIVPVETIAGHREFWDLCPYGVPGDRLWLRETFWCKNDTCDHEYCSGCDMGSMLSLGEGYASVEYCATPRCAQLPTLKNQQTVVPYQGKAMPGDWLPVPSDRWDGNGDGLDNIEREGVFEFSPWQYFTKHPSIHMPRWASRITLEVKRVWVERVQEISWLDAIAEGVKDPRKASLRTCPERGPVAGFRELWDSINADRGHGWDTNPWVWCVEFERVEGER